MLRFSLLLVGAVMVLTDATFAEGTFLERFALSKNREEVLKELIPGTREYYYYHCLHYQNTKQLDRVDGMVTKWVERHKNGPLLEEIQYRQALLTYDLAPKKTLDFIRDKRGLRFNHQKDTPDSRPNLPTSFDQTLISRDTLKDRAMRSAKDLRHFEDRAWRWLVREDLDDRRRRDLLHRMQRPDVDRLPEMVVADLRAAKSGGFGSHGIHSQLLLSQLQKCAQLMPELLANNAFVQEWVKRLRPNNDIDMRLNQDERSAYLVRLWDFVKTLPPNQNSLKAHVLYQQLVFDAQQGRYDKSVFMQYLKLPRRVEYIDSDYMKREANRRHVCDLNANFKAYTTMPSVGNDEALVRDYLMQFLVRAESTGEFEPYLNDLWLQHVFAETKIVNGVGDPEKWYSLLPPEMYRKLRDRIDIDFAKTNQQHYAPDDAVALDVFVKNVPTLIVKVFEINAANFYRDTGREVNTDINLDGLVASREQTIEYEEAPLRRVKRRFEFPELNKRGVYVIDFIGNGKASRALVRKGRLHFVTDVTVAGQRFTILNENNEQVKDASLLIGNQDYQADEDGRITVPFSTKPGKKPVIIKHDSFVSLGHFNHAVESPAFSAAMFVDREELVRRNTATLLVRPQLQVNGVPVSLAAVEDVELMIDSTDHDGVHSTQVVTDFKLFEDRESTHEFSVPNRLTSIQFTVTGKVLNASQGKDIDVSASRVFTINQTDKTNHIVDMHFGRVGEQFVIDVLGRTGEARADVAVRVEVKHADFKKQVKKDLKSDKSGRILLGELAGIEQVSATLPDGLARSWTTATAGHVGSRTVHKKQGELVHIRTILEAEQFNREHVSVFELRGNELIADQFAAASLADGFVTLKDLPAGDFRVSLLEETGERTVLVRIADGVRDQQHIFGSSRKLTTELLDELQIAESKVVGDKLQIRLAQGSKFARVHVFANTFRPEYSPLLLSTNRPGLATQGMAIARSLYVEGRNIGDEYRYILDRRYADKYPGNMNTRPGILLNPWDIRTTQTGTQDAAKGDNFAPKAAAPALRAAVDAEQLGRMAQIAAGQEPPNLDFLADSAVVLPNLVPNEDGSITINLEDLGGHQEVHIVALDPINTVWKSVSLPKKEMKSLDLRLASGFDPKKDFSQQKKISVIKSGETFELEDLSTSQMVMYDSLRGVFQLFETLDGNENLAKFRFVLDWPTLDEDKKRDLYSEHACHELNYFVFRRDPKFFGDVVKPYLTNKFDKTFLDEWLLGADVSRHVQPYLYARLNTFERILLAQRIESEREASRRFVIDQYDLLPPNTAESQRLFATALKASSLGLAFGDDDAGGFGGAGGGLGGGGFGGGGVRAYSGAAIEMEAAPAFSRESLKELGVSEKKSGGGTELSRKRKARAGKGVARRSAGRQMLGADDDEIESLYEQRGLAERGRRQLFRQVDKTKEWAENNYYRLPLEKQDSSLVRVDGFWADYASHHDGPFVSAHVAEAANSFTEMMLALAVLDLPFESSEHKIDKADGRLSMTTASAGIIVHEQIRPAKEADDKPPVLVGQNFFRADDRHRIENNQKVDKFVTDEFLIHTVYGAQVVITNPTSTPRILTGLVQIPQGALPVAGAKYTESKTLQLDPYATKTIEYLFYFPTPGQFAHYPIHVARDGEMVAEAQAFTFNVVTEPTSVDQESWEYVSQYASADDVLKYLRENNLNRIELSRIAWRMQDKTFFKKSTELLDERHQFDHTLWSYAAHHNDKNRLTEFLRNDPKFVAECGAVLDSPLLTIDPVERRTYEFFEYKPLVNARAHKLGADRKILNDRFSKQYASLMTVLSQRDKLTDRDLLSVSYYMLLQDRIGDALDYFGQVNPENLPSKLQHDYFAAYADFYSKGLATAKAMVDRYTDYPVKHWREMFASMGQQIKEIEGDKPEVPESADPKNRDDQIARLAAADCSLDIAVDRTEVQVDFENLQSVQVNYYLMDIELLFSRNPFVQGPSGHFSHVKPNEKTTLQLPRDKTRFRFELPKDLQNRNVLVEVVGRGQTQTAAYYSNSLSLQTIDNYGQLKVTSVKDNAALSGTYVKAYAKMKDGEVKFYKDGYTDLRGRFDYASLSTNQLDNVQRFSLLIMSEEHGAIVKEVEPPTR